MWRSWCSIMNNYFNWSLLVIIFCHAMMFSINRAVRRCSSTSNYWLRSTLCNYHTYTSAEAKSGGQQPFSDQLLQLQDKEIKRLEFACQKIDRHYIRARRGHKCVLHFLSNYPFLTSSRWLIPIYHDFRDLWLLPAVRNRSCKGQGQVHGILPWNSPMARSQMWGEEMLLVEVMRSDFFV